MESDNVFALSVIEPEAEHGLLRAVLLTASLTLISSRPQQLFV